MDKKEIKLKYKSMSQLLDDMDYLVQLGFAEIVFDSNTQREGYRIRENGIIALKDYTEGCEKEKVQ